MNEQMDKSTDQWLNRRMDGWTDNERTDRSMDQWMDGQMDGWRSRQENRKTGR